jgi:hypothetical protein
MSTRRWFVTFSRANWKAEHDPEKRAAVFPRGKPGTRWRGGHV